MPHKLAALVLSLVTAGVAYTQSQQIPCFTILWSLRYELRICTGRSDDRDKFTDGTLAFGK